MSITLIGIVIALAMNGAQGYTPGGQDLKRWTDMVTLHYNEMSAWLEKNGPTTEKALMQWDAMPPSAK